MEQIVVFGGMLPAMGGSGMIATGTGNDLTSGRVAPPLIAGDDPRGYRQINRLVGFDANWEIDLFGKNRRALEAARNDAETQMELRNAVLITVIADVAHAYVDIRGLQMRLELARRNVAMAKRTVDLTMEKLLQPSSGSDRKPAAAGVKAPEDETKTSKNENKSSKQEDKDDNKSSKQKKKSEDNILSNESSLAEARSALNNQQAKLPELGAAISAAENRLAGLLGTYGADIEGAIRGPAKLPPLPQRLRPGIPVDLLRRRPDIRAAERELAAATQRIGVAIADLFPSVGLTAGFGGEGTVGRFGAVAPPLHGPLWTVGPRAYWPLLDFGRLDALINIEEMRAHEDLIRYKKIIIAAAGEVDQAIRQYHLELQRWKALDAAQAELRRNIDLTADRYGRDEATLRDVIDVQRRYYILAEEAATAEEGAVLRYVAFYKALGGGWELYADLPPLPATQPAVVASVRRWKGGWR